ncbi:hypothetical protein BDV19DRAFT_48534 [Aspergillus venezuelensis]
MLQNSERPPCWVLTRTPFKKSPSDILPYIEVLVRPHWYSHPELQHCTPEALKSLSREFNQIKTNSANRNGSYHGLSVHEVRGKVQVDLAPITQEVARILETIGFIRRTAESQWNSKPLLELPPIEPQYINCPLSEAGSAYLVSLLQRSRVAAHLCATEGSRGNQGPVSTLVHRLRVASGLPGLAAVYTKHHSPNLEEWIWKMQLPLLNDWLEHSRKCLVTRHLKAALEHSTR